MASIWPTSAARLVLWDAWSSTAQNSASSATLVMFNAFNQSFFMGFFFLLAGYFTAPALAKKGYSRFLQDRMLRLGIPLLFGYDTIHGYRTVFPVPLALAASFDPEVMRTSAAVGARESAAAGIHWVFAPMVDVSRDPRWGRIVESAGEDVLLNRTLAAASVQGAGDTVLGCVKHYAAYGAAEAGRDYNTVDMSEGRLRDVYLPSYAAADRPSG